MNSTRKIIILLLFSSSKYFLGLSRNRWTRRSGHGRANEGQGQGLFLQGDHRQGGQGARVPQAAAEPVLGPHHPGERPRVRVRAQEGDRPEQEQAEQTGGNDSDNFGNNAESLTAHGGQILKMPKKLFSANCHQFQLGPFFEGIFCNAFSAMFLTHVSCKNKNSKTFFA